MVELPVTAAWGSGAYVTATLIRPMDVAARRNPARAIGARLGGGRSRAAAAGGGVRGARPRRRRAAVLEAVLRIDGLAPGAQAYATDRRGGSSASST